MHIIAKRQIQLYGQEKSLCCISIKHPRIIHTIRILLIYCFIRERNGYFEHWLLNIKAFFYSIWNNYYCRKKTLLEKNHHVLLLVTLPTGVYMVNGRKAMTSIQE